MIKIGVRNWYQKNMIALLVLALCAVAACSNEDELKWTEEVKLEDGRVLTVARRSVFRGPREIGQPVTTSWIGIDFKHPNTQEAVHFESALFSNHSDSSPVVVAMQYPIALMMNGDELFIVLKPHSALSEQLGCIDPPYLLMKWQSGRWQQRQLMDIPYRKFANNITVDEVSRAKLIKQSNYHLSVKVTYAPNTNRGPYIIDLSGMTRQTSGKPYNCQGYRSWAFAEKNSN